MKMLLILVENGESNAISEAKESKKFSSIWIFKVILKTTFLQKITVKTKAWKIVPIVYPNII
jgi:hypothetical protein